MSKIKLRKKFLIQRKNNFNSSNINFSLLNKILKKFKIIKTKRIGAYYPINYEIECFKIIKKLEILGHKISLPVINKKNKMDFFEWSFDNPLRVG